MSSACMHCSSSPPFRERGIVVVPKINLARLGRELFWASFLVRIVARIIPDNVVKEIETHSGCIYEVLKKLGYSRESIVVLYKGEPVLENTCLEDGEMVEIYVATSGG